MFKTLFFKFCETCTFDFFLNYNIFQSTDEFLCDFYLTILFSFIPWTWLFSFEIVFSPVSSVSCTMKWHFHGVRSLWFIDETHGFSFIFVIFVISCLMLFYFVKDHVHRVKLNVINTTTSSQDGLFPFVLLLQVARSKALGFNITKCYKC